jgi:hypothetical protein
VSDLLSRDVFWNRKRSEYFRSEKLEAAAPRQPTRGYASERVLRQYSERRVRGKQGGKAQGNENGKETSRRKRPEARGASEEPGINGYLEQRRGGHAAGRAQQGENITETDATLRFLVLNRAK